MNYRLLIIGEIRQAGDEYWQHVPHTWKPVPTEWFGSEIPTDSTPHRRPIVSAWLPIVAGDVTFPCFLGLLNKYHGWTAYYWTQTPIFENYAYTHWLPSPEPPEQLSPDEKAWAEYCATKAIGMTADKASFMAGRASVEGDNERK